MEVITTHANADFDSLASMVAAKKLYPEAVLAFSGSQEKGLRDFLIQSTLYVLEIERLKNIDFERIHRLILVDTRQMSRIGKFAGIIGKPNLDIHIYDHHPPSSDDLSGSLEIIKKVGATTTILVQILKEKDMEITPDEATVMSLGIHEDTGSLTFSSTTVDDYLIAGYLLSKGANLNVVSDMIIKEFTAEDISLLNELIHSTTSHIIHGVEVAIAKISTDNYIGDFSVLVHKLRDLKGINVLFVLARMEDRIHLVCRSRVNAVNAGEIALEFGGGGHSTAASATIKDLTLIQAEEKLLSILHNKIATHPWSAKDIMTFPVKVVESAEPLENARKLLTRYNINMLPVVKKNKLIGLISRQIIEKAAHHGLKDLPIEDFMTTDFSIVSPNTSLLKIQELIIGNNQRFLPVVENGIITGTITRTGLLRVMETDLMKKSSRFHGSYRASSFMRKKSVRNLMKERVEKRILRMLEKLGKKAEELHYNAYLVGGFTRDLILRRENFDVDIVVEGDGIELARKCAREFSCKIKSHKKFGTSTLLFSNNFKIDIATARLEYYESPAALPTVELSSIKLDLYRRDFTMNTLAIRLNPPVFGELIDFFGAQKDIKESVIRIIHNLSFVEDPTRIFRAIRFEQRFGFQIGKHTTNLIKNAVKMNFLAQLDGYRFFSELILILQEDEPVPMIRRLADFNILKFIHPKIRFNKKMETSIQSIKKITSWFDLLFLEEKYEKWIIYLFSLLDSLKDKEICEVCQRLSIQEKDKKRVLHAIQYSKALIGTFSGGDELQKSDIYDLLKPLSTEILLYAMAKTDQDSLRKAVSLYFTHLKETQVIINGDDLLSMGIPPGKIFKRILDDLLNAKLDEKVETKEDEVNFVKKHYLGHASS